MTETSSRVPNWKYAFKGKSAQIAKLVPTCQDGLCGSLLCLSKLTQDDLPDCHYLLDWLACVYVVCMDVLVHVVARGQLSVFLSWFLLTLWDMRLSLNLRTSNLSKTCLHPPQLGAQTCIFYVGSGELNSRPHGCMASTLSTELSLSPRW